MALPLASVAAPATTLSLGLESSSVVSITQDVMIRHGVRRIVFRNSLGQFARGTGMRETSRMYFQRMGLNGLGQATRFTPVVPQVGEQ